MEFEFDSKKSDDNKEKHGIDFYEGQALWDYPDFIEIPVRTSDESRFLVMGKISRKLWSGVIPYASAASRPRRDYRSIPPF